MSNIAEILRKKMFEKRLKAVDLAKGTNITPSVISRYLSGTNQPSTKNLIAIGNYFGVHPQSLLSPSEAPESIQSAKVTPLATEPLLGQIEAQIKLIHYLEKRVKELEEAKEESKERHTTRRQKAKNPTKSNKPKVGLLRKRKAPKK